MKGGGLRKYLDRVRPSFEEGGGLSWLHSLYEAVDTTVSVPGTLTGRGAHVRDCIDLKRIMLCVVVSLLPCLIFAGIASDPVRLLEFILVSLAVSYTVDLIASQLRGRPLCEGNVVTALIIALIVPAETPLFILAPAVAFAILVGKVAFGGAGMNIWNPALLTDVFILFGFPDLAGGGSMMESCGFSWFVAVGLGALLLIYTGTASWKVMLSAAAGALAAAIFAPASDLSLNFFAFGIVFMATDPVTGAQTEAGKWIYGFLIGVLFMAVRSLGLADADGTMTAILVMNTFAPLIDRIVISANINSRQRRNLTV